MESPLGFTRVRHAKCASGPVSLTLQPEDPGPSAPRGGAQSRSPGADQGSGRAAMAPTAPEARQSATSLASSASSASSNDSSGGRDEGRHGAGGASSASTGAMVQREDILVLTHDVRAFKEALGRLRKTFAPEAHEKQRRETRLVAAHERLGQVLRILRSILEKYPPIQSAELLVAASALIQRVKGHDYGPGGSSSSQACFEAVDHLALAFSSRVSEYLMGDLDTGSTSAIGKARSCENLLSPDKQAPTTRSYASPMTLTGPEADAKLMRIDDGVEFALRRAKVWSKYAKDVISYVEKRANLEAEHARNLLKLAQTMRPVLKEESFLPFQSIYCTAIDQDLDNANNCLSNCTLLHDHKFVEPLTARRNEHEKARKQLKEAWQRELKRMQELEANVRKARALYVQRHQEHDKAAQRADGDERRRRVEEEALQKAREAETTYKACVVEANERIVALERTKAEVLQQVRELMCQCDQTMKAVTVAYFQLQHTVTAPAPIQFQTLCESSRLYEPGSQYLEFVRRIPAGRHPVEPKLLAFEPIAGDTRTESRRVHEAELEPLDQTALEARLASEARPAGWAGGASDSDGSNRSGDTSPAASPQAMARTMLLTVSSGDELDTDHDNERAAGRPMCLSLAAETHSFRKLRTPSRCRECDSYVYFQGVECSECGLSSHKKCLETLAIRCGHKRLPRKMTTFGVELGGQPADEVPYIVRRCIAEMDARGYGVRGLYRVSGVKSKVERLCQCFENGATLVDLSDSPPHVVANVLKLYLRQLPEPLLTYRLYPHFIALAKEHPGGTGVAHHHHHHHSEEDEDDLGEDEARVGADHHHDDEEEEAVVAALRSLVAQLPPLHARTLAALLRHLARVAAHSHLNQMPAGNLAIVFGPTLLRTSEGSASLSSLVDTVHQTRVIELLIMYVDRIFPDDTPHREQEQQVVEEQYTLLEAVTLRRCASAGDVESAIADEGEGTTHSQDSDDAAEPVVLASQLTGGAVHQWCGGGGSEDAESEASDEGGLRQQPLANSGSSSSGGVDRLGAPSSASEDAAEPPVPPPRRGGARRVEARSCTRDTWSTTTSSSSSQQSAQPKACNMAELRRQFFEAPWGGASLEELAAAGSRPSLLARHLLATPARTSSEPQLPANDESGGAGSGTSRQSTSPHVAEARRRAHSPLRESVSLKKHWFSTDEASSSSSSCGGAGGGGDAGDPPATTRPIASPQPGPPRHE